MTDENDCEHSRYRDGDPECPECGAELEVEDKEEWKPCQFPCPDCGSPAEEAPWWDDRPEAGGQVIGELRRCTKCEWFVSL